MSCVEPAPPEDAAAPNNRKEMSSTESSSNPSEEAAVPENETDISSNTEQNRSSPTDLTKVKQLELTSQHHSKNSQIQVPSSSAVAAAAPVAKLKNAREMLAQSAQELVEELNNKRTQDTQMINDFRANLELHTQRVVEQTEENLFKMYEKQSAIVQAKLQELNETLHRIDQLESEMQEFKQALGMLYVDMNEK